MCVHLQVVIRDTTRETVLTVCVADRHYLREVHRVKSSMKYSIRKKEGGTAVDAAVFKGRSVNVKGIEGESSFEGSSCGVAMLGFFNDIR
jgi:hypothetical protein